MSSTVTTTHSSRRWTNILFNSCCGGSVNHCKVLSILWLILSVPRHWHHHA